MRNIFSVAIFLIFFSVTEAQESFIDSYKKGLQYSNEKKYEYAIVKFNVCLDSIMVNKVEGSKSHLLVLDKLADCYYSLKRFDSAIVCCKEIVSLYDKLKEPLKNSKSDYCLLIMLCYEKQKDFQNAILYCDTLLTLLEEEGKNTSNLYSNMLLRQSTHYREMGDITKSIDCIKRTLPISIQKGGARSLGYATTLYNISAQYSAFHYDDSSLVYAQKSVDVIRNLDSIPESKQAMFLHQLSLSYKNCGQLTNAYKAITQCLHLKKISSGENSEDFAVSKALLADIYADQGNYIESIKTNESVLNNLKDWDYLTSCYNNLAISYSYIGDHESAIRAYKSSLLYVKENSPNYVMKLINMATEYAEMGEYSKSMECSHRALNICSSFPQKNHYLYGKSYAALGSCYYKIGDLHNALYYMSNAIDELRQIDGISDKNLLSHYNSIVVICNDLKKHDEVYYKYADSLLLLSEIIYGRKSRTYLQSLYNTNYFKEDSNADSICLYACKMIKDSIESNPFDYAVISGRLARSYAERGKPEAWKMIDEAIVEYKRVMTPSNLEYLVFFNRLMPIFFDNNRKGLYDFVIQHQRNSTNFLTEKFKLLPTKQRESMFENHFRRFYEDLPLYVIRNHPDSIICVGLNGELFSKGLLLNAERSASSIIAECGDSNIMQKYDELRLLRAQIEKLYEMSPGKRFLSIDSLTMVADAIERELLKSSKAYGDYTNNLTINWQMVKNALRKDEAALEYVSAYNKNTDSIYYAAYVLRYDAEAPQFIKLQTFAKNKSQLTAEFHKQNMMTQWVWGALEESLKGIKTVFFSPSGEMYKIAIESLPDYEDSTRFISDRYNLYRLSSTRELARDRETTSILNGRVYGGLRYDAVVDTTLRGSYNERDFYYSARLDSISSQTRGDLPGYLPNTLTEAQYIEGLMKRSAIITRIYTGDEGDEDSFKRLSGQNVNLLHIATHGFYYDETPDMKKEEEMIVTTDKSMTRSGLLFAGANNTLRNASLRRNTYNDGVLTAQEIAQLDLRSVDMVVLSACETGPGELKGDGVFGLQRGFKKAGVNSIIMSLWKVDDRATQMLMTQFYENWLIKKMTKQKALKAAQEYVRNFEVDETEWERMGNDRGVVGGPYRPATSGKKKKPQESPSVPQHIVKPMADPYYWAGFILLDGLD